MSYESKDNLGRWVPTLVAILAIVGQIFYFGSRLGADEIRLSHVELSSTSFVTRAEYMLEKEGSTMQFSDIKQSLRDINSKLDRITDRK